MRKIAKFVFVLIATLFVCIPVIAQSTTGNDSMPKVAKDFITSTFPDATVTNYTVGNGGYYVTLSNGVRK